MRAYPRYLPRYPISDIKNSHPIRSRCPIFRTLIMPLQLRSIIFPSPLPPEQSFWSREATTWGMSSFLFWKRRLSDTGNDLQLLSFIDWWPCKTKVNMWPDANRMFFTCTAIQFIYFLVDKCEYCGVRIHINAIFFNPSGTDQVYSGFR